MVNQSDSSLFPGTTYIGNGGLITANQADILIKFPRVMASLTLTIGGTITNLDTITVNVNLGVLPGGKIAKTISVTGSDTVTTMAQKVVQAFADDATFQAYGGVIYAAGAVVTVKMPGLLGNEATLTRTLSGGATLTGTISNSGAFSGGSGPVIPHKTFSFSYAGNTLLFEAGKPAIVNAGIVKELAANKQPVY